MFDGLNIIWFYEIIIIAEFTPSCQGISSERKGVGLATLFNNVPTANPPLANHIVPTSNYEDAFWLPQHILPSHNV